MITIVILTTIIISAIAILAWHYDWTGEVGTEGRLHLYRDYPVGKPVSNLVARLTVPVCICGNLMTKVTGHRIVTCSNQDCRRYQKLYERPAWNANMPSYHQAQRPTSTGRKPPAA